MTTKTIVTSMPTMDDVFRKFGEVAEASQLLETEVGNCIFGVSPADLTDTKKAELWRWINGKATLGAQIIRLKSQPTGYSFEISEEVSRLLDSARDDRNYICHSFYLKHNLRKFEEIGREFMILDLCKRHVTILRAWQALLKMTGTTIDISQYEQELDKCSFAWCQHGIGEPPKLPILGCWVLRHLA